MRSSTAEDTLGADFDNRFTRFLGEWNAAVELTANRHGERGWKEFFDNWCKHSPLIPAAQFIQTPVLEPGHFADFVGAFPIAFDEYRRNGSMLNVWATAQLGTDEVRNCKVLATFLDHTANHGQGADILCSLLSMVGLPEFAAHASRRRYRTRTEVWPLDSADSRVDIEIEGDEFLIFIEAKITASEGVDQLQRYVELARAKAVYRDWTVMFLTPDGREPANVALSDLIRVHSISWEQISRAVQSCMIHHDAHRLARHLLLQYAEFVHNFG